MKEKVTFYLKEPNSNKDTLVYAFFHYRNQVVKVSAGVQVHPKSWNHRKYRANPSAMHAGLINEHLANVAETLTGIYLRLLTEGVPATPDEIKKRYREQLNTIVSQPKPLDLFATYERFKDEMGGKLQPSTLKVHQTTMNHLKDFQKAYDIAVSFERIDRLFFEKLVSYLVRVANLNNGTAWKIVKAFRAFLRYAYEHGITANTEYQKFTQRMMPKGEKSQEVYLTLEELQEVMNLDLSANPRLDRSRDLFLLQIHTGLRYSDVQKLREEHIQGDSIRLVTQKNRKAITIPLLPVAREILHKYGSSLPVLTLQKQNEYIKELMKEAKIETSIVTVNYRGAERIEKVTPKYKLMGTHTAKRTFVTLLRQRGVSIEAIMRVTGNTRRTIETYILNTESDVAREIEAAWQEVNVG